MKIATLLVLSMLVFGPCVKADSTYNFQSFGVPLANSTRALAINDSGQIVGSYLTDGLTWQGFLYQHGNFTTLDFPGLNPQNDATFVTDINNLGQVVGNHQEAFINNFIYSSGSFTSVDTPYMTTVSGINDHGEMVGYGYYLYQGFLDNKGTITSIHACGITGANGINNAGEIVGDCSVTKGAPSHGFLYTGTQYLTIDFPGALSTSAVRINNLGQIVGEYVDASQTTHGFLYSDGTFTTIDFPDAVWTQPLGINDSGDIVGLVPCSNSSSDCAFLATPTTEPTTLLLLIAGLLVLVGLNLKRFAA